MIYVSHLHPAQLHAGAALASLQVSRDQLLVASQRAQDANADDDLGTLQAWRPREERAATAVRREPILDAVVARGATAVRSDPYADRLLSIHDTLTWLATELHAGQPTVLDPLARLRARLQHLPPSTALIVCNWVDEQDQAARKLLGEPDDRLPVPGLACPACGLAGVLAIRTSAVLLAEQVMVCTTVACVCRGEGCSCEMAVQAAGVRHIWTRRQIASA